MLNYIWSGMLFLGIIWGAFHGRLAQVTEGALSAAGEAVTLSLTMVGIVAGRAAFRENEAHIKVSVSRSANGL